MIIFLTIGPVASEYVELLPLLYFYFQLISNLFCFFITMITKGLLGMFEGLFENLQFHF